MTEILRHTRNQIFPTFSFVLNFLCCCFLNQMFNSFFHQVLLSPPPCRSGVRAQPAELHGPLGLQRCRTGMRLPRRPPGLLCRAPARRGRVLLLALHPRLALWRHSGVRRKKRRFGESLCLSVIAGGQRSGHGGEKEKGRREDQSGGGGVEWEVSDTFWSEEGGGSRAGDGERLLCLSPAEEEILSRGVMSTTASICTSRLCGDVTHLSAPMERRARRRHSEVSDGGVQ